MTNKDKEKLLPPVGYEFALGPYLFRVVYVNAGKMRFSAVLRGMLQEEPQKGDGHGGDDVDQDSDDCGADKGGS